MERMEATSTTNHPSAAALATVLAQSMNAIENNASGMDKNAAELVALDIIKAKNTGGHVPRSQSPAVTGTTNGGPSGSVLKPLGQNQVNMLSGSSAASRLPTLQDVQLRSTGKSLARSNSGGFPMGFNANQSFGAGLPSPGSRTATAPALLSPQATPQKDVQRTATPTPSHDLQEQQPTKIGSSEDKDAQMDVDHEGSIHIQSEEAPSSLQDSQSPPAAKSTSKKRKRTYTYEEQREWERAVKRKLEDERDRVEAEEGRHESSNRELYALFNDLQGFKADFGFQFAAPELVVVGGQSDGKSSFVEGLLGFQFNIVESGIGTRRPLVIQMINNPQFETPSCRFRRETTAENATVGWSASDFEEEVPIHLLSEKIAQRTEQRAGPNKDRVSDVPIILRVEYKHCANLTIFDTPGFRTTGNMQLADDITRMVTRLMEPENRIIVCLEQSTVEWSCSSSRPFVARVDPQFRRTVLVMTKFDNRVKELRDAEEANGYLVGENLPAAVKPFFISLPVRRPLDPERFKAGMRDCYLSDYRFLSEARFEERQFLPQVGFFRLKRFLEDLLQEKYVESLVPTLGVLEQMCEESVRELEQVTEELKNNDIQIQISKVSSYITTLSKTVESFFDGTAYCDVELWGQKLEDERVASGAPSWPGENMRSLSADVPNSTLRLTGGSQIERLLDEFEFAVLSVEFPSSPMDEVAAVIRSRKGSNVMSVGNAAVALVKKKATLHLQPLLSILLKRASYLLRRQLDVVVAELAKDHCADFGLVGQFEGFQKELKSAYDGFVASVTAECEKQIMGDFNSLVRFINTKLTAGMQAVGGAEVGPTFEETRKRVLSSTQPENEPLLNMNGSALSEDVAKAVCGFGAKMWAGVRMMVSKTTNCKMNAIFFSNFFEKLGPVLSEHFRKLPEGKFHQMFQTGVAELKHRHNILETQIQRLNQSRDRFREVVNKIQERSKHSSSADHAMRL